LETAPAGSFYPIGLGFFDFEIDYFALLPSHITEAVKQQQIRLLFYYHEGDNPQRIQQRLTSLILRHQLPPDCYVFVSGNSAARDLPGFVYFADFELWYWQRNREQPPLPIHQQSRSHEFTVLSRLHRTWRAMVMADLHRSNVLINSYWSYCEAPPPEVDLNDSPIEVDSIAKLRHETGKFLAYAPYFSDELSNHERNNHSITVAAHHTDSYCNIVLETHFDADGSGGTFLTEKTFKPIKHGQLFFVAGPAGSLQALRDLGYQTFDDVLDNSYDLCDNATQRWQMLKQSIQQAQPQLPELFARALPQIQHNQQLFCQLKTQRLNNLIKDIHEQHH
jgi:hypothetical protein